MEFKNVYNQDTSLLMGNVGDVTSTQIVEKLGFQAIGTSSAVIANILGYKDGEKMKFSELSYVVDRMIENTYLPLSVDIESGYSREPDEIADNIKTRVNLGVVGINIEDNVVTKKRIQLFEYAGADGIFVPCIENEDDIQAITESSYLPINDMCKPNLSDFRKRKDLGVKRISMFNFLFANMYCHFENILKSVVKLQTFKSVL